MPGGGPRQRRARLEAGGRLLHALVRALQRGLVLLILLTAGSSLAHAETSTVSRARAHFESGKTRYAEGRYRESIAEFRAGFDLVPRALFLLNLGQAHRKLGEVREARAYFQKFLDAAPAVDPDRGSVSELCIELDAQIASLPPPAAAPSPPAPMVLASPPSPPRSFIRRHWWIIPVTTVALTGLGLGLYFGLRERGSACADFSYGCVTVGE